MSSKKGYYDKRFDLDRPLYTVIESEAKIKAIDALIADVQSKPVGVGVPGAGNAHWAGRLTDLRKERNVWESRLAEARAYDLKCSEGSVRSAVQGPRQIIE